MPIDTILSYKLFQDCKDTITPNSKEQLVLVYKMCKEKKWNFHNLGSLLKNMVKYDVVENWTERITRSKEEFKNDSSSLLSFQNRYGEERGKILWETKTKATTITKEEYTSKYGAKAWEELCTSKASIDEKSFINRYGEEDGKRKRQEYLEKWTKVVKSKGGWDNGLSMNSFVERHGEEKGYEIWNKRIQNQRHRFSKKWFQTRHGDLWESEWDKYCSHMANMSSIGMGKGNCHTYSKKSQQLFWAIGKKMEANKFSKARFYEQGGETKFNINENWGHYYYTDFILDNSVIEFDGKYWHKKERAILRDPLVTKDLISKGYQVLRINEREYDENPLKVIDKCVMFLDKDIK